MSLGPQITALSGNRLHLHHGPIDLILWAQGQARSQAYAKAIARFETVLPELAAELTELRQTTPTALQGVIACKMQMATEPFRPRFITPMAAVAGAVADEVLAAMTAGTGLLRAYVNNGGDIAIHLARDQSLTSAIALPRGAQDRVTLRHLDPARGIATSGWRGRSFSLGIADAVTVVARTAAMADAAATMIANQVNLPGHPAITRSPAHDVQYDSDLGSRVVTTGVERLDQADVARALRRGQTAAQDYLSRGLIAGAALFLQSKTQTLGTFSLEKEPALA
jgi:ApbE superfamily uncharacterized protein (UPF0280 family)